MAKNTMKGNMGKMPSPMAAKNAKMAKGEAPEVGKKGKMAPPFGKMKGKK